MDDMRVTKLTVVLNKPAEGDDDDDADDDRESEKSEK